MESWRHSSTLRRQLVFFGETASGSIASVDQAPVLVFEPPGSFISSNSISPICFGEPMLNSRPASPYASCFVLQHALREIAGETREHLRIDLDPLALHRRQHRRQRALQCFVDGDEAFGASSGFSLRQRRSAASACSQE